MLTLADVRDWLKSFDFAEHYYIGKLDNKNQKSIGVYQRKESGMPRIALGGLGNTGFDIKRVSVLLHWNKNAAETEDTALALFERLKGITDIQIGKTQVKYLMLLVPEPQDVGTDDAGVYERVIWFDLYYER